MSTTSIMLMGGPAHGTFRSVDGALPTHLRIPSLAVEVPTETEDRLVVAVYRKGDVERAPSPMRGSIGVYWFQKYEEVLDE